MYRFRFSILGIILLLSIVSCQKHTYLADVKSNNRRIEKVSYTIDKDVADLIAPYKEKLDLVMNEVIGHNEEELKKDKPNSTLGSWFTDAVLEEINHQKGIKADFTVQNYGGIRVPTMSAGHVTVGTIYEVMPFDNTMMIIEMKGSIVQLLFDRIADSGGWPISQTVKFDIEFGKARNIYIKDMPLDTNKVYSAAIPDYVANGGDNTWFLTDLEKFDTQILLRDLLINNVKRNTAAGKNIVANHQPRINY